MPSPVHLVLKPRSFNTYELHFFFASYSSLQRKHGEFLNLKISFIQSGLGITCKFKTHYLESFDRGRLEGYGKGGGNGYNTM